MSMRNTALGFGIVTVIAGGVAWWGISNSQTQNQAAQVQNQIQTQAAQAQAQEQGARLENERNTVDVVQRTQDGVVYVSVTSRPTVAIGSNVPDFFAPFLQEQPRQGTGSGFVIDTDGLILTNYHVVEGATEITVRFHNDPKAYPAKVVGTAQPLDMALIKVQAPKERLKPMTLGNSDTIKVGQKAIAMGNPFGLEFTVTEGIISAIRRNPGAIGDESGFIPSVLQTDAAINPGNSGGPLLNSAGQVVGINTAIYSTNAQFGGEGQSAGIGFAIPINIAKQYLPDLKAGKKLTADTLAKSRPRLGVSLYPAITLYPENIRTQNKLPDYGLMVQEVEKGGPAEKAGLRAASKTVQLQTQNGQVVELGVNGDIIVEADGNPVNDITDLRSAILSKKQGEALNLKIWRNGQTVNVQIVPQIIK
ncbi:MAG: serine protease [Meiothermus sp.]